MTVKNHKVIFDTNVWISFLIGKRLSFIKNYIANKQIILVVSDQLLKEITDVTGRKKMAKYFPKESIDELLLLLNTIALKFQTTPKHLINRDPKDNFLLDLIDVSNADFLVTGDKDLLAHDPFKTARILKPSEFESIFLNKMEQLETTI